MVFNPGILYGSEQEKERDAEGNERLKEDKTQIRDNSEKN